MIKGAEAGNVKLVTSSITVTEVIKLGKGREIPEDDQEKVVGFFRHEWIIVRMVDREVAEYARQLIWKYGFVVKDSIHVSPATAVIERIPRMDTCDGELIKRSGEIGDPPLIIGRPATPHETSFEDMLADQNADR